MIYTLGEAKSNSWKCVDEYGEPYPYGTLGVMRSCWWSGVRYGVAFAFMPGISLIIIGLWLQ